MRHIRYSSYRTILGLATDVQVIKSTGTEAKVIHRYRGTGDTQGT